MDKQTTDYWQGRFAPAQERNQGGGYALYRQCLKCSGFALSGSESAHARWCDQQAHKAATLAAFDDLARADRRVIVDRRNAIRAAAREAL